MARVSTDAVSSVRPSAVASEPVDGAGVPGQPLQDLPALEVPHEQLPVLACGHERPVIRESDPRDAGLVATAEPAHTARLQIEHAHAAFHRTEREHPAVGAYRPGGVPDGPRAHDAQGRRLELPGPVVASARDEHATAIACRGRVVRRCVAAERQPLHDRAAPRVDPVHRRGRTVRRRSVHRPREQLAAAGHEDDVRCTHHSPATGSGGKRTRSRRRFVLVSMRSNTALRCSGSDWSMKLTAKVRPSGEKRTFWIRAGLMRYGGRRSRRLAASYTPTPPRSSPMAMSLPSSLMAAPNRPQP